MRLPNLWAQCEACDVECAGHPPENVAWSPRKQKWICSECWGEDQEYDEARDEYVVERPMAYAKDVLDSQEEMHRRLVASAAAKRMGV